MTDQVFVSLLDKRIEEIARALLKQILGDSEPPPRSSEQASVELRQINSHKIEGTHHR